MSLLSVPVPKQLLDELEKRFPPKRYTPTETYPEIMHYSGKLDVIAYIKASYEAQQNPENNFKTPIR